MHNKIAIVGGIPDPIGGVTTFIRRLIKIDKNVQWIFDLYPSKSKNLPEEFAGEFICHKFKILTLIRLVYFLITGKADYIHFNFSTPRSLILLAILPKLNTKWILMLHHGQLGNAMKRWVRWILRYKVDHAFALNQRQYQWYKNNGLLSENIYLTSPYVIPSSISPSLNIAENINTLKQKYKNIFVCSGYPTKIYNHHLAIESMRLFNEDFLFCCLYGTGGQLDELKSQAASLSNVSIVEALTEDDFNYILSNADIYLRLNIEDSYGIAVSDALYFGVKVLATNVCARPSGANLIDVPTTVDNVIFNINEIIDNKTFEKFKPNISCFDYAILSNT